MKRKNRPKKVWIDAYGRTKGAAERDGKRCLKKLHGTGWKLWVYENLGWHWRISNGSFTVYSSWKGYYWAMLVPSYSLWTERNHPDYIDPNKAVRRALEYAKPFVQEYVDILAKAERSIET